MDICGDKLIDMINSDYRSKEFAEYNDNTFLSNGSQDFFHLDSFDDTANDGKIGWLNSSQLLNVSSDFDTDTAIYVNPGTVLPIPEPVNSPLLPEFPFTESFAIVSSESQESSSVSASTNIPVISSDKVLDSSSSDETVATPSPSPNTHNILKFSAQESDVTQDSDESSKLKSKSKNAKSNHRVQEIIYPKPVYSYSCLIAMALKNSKTGSLPVNEIYDFMTENFPYFKTAPNGWKNSVRHNLSLNKCFEKIEKPAGVNSTRKGFLWAMNPAKIEKMEEELQKWGNKDPVAIRKSMANPERLELIEKGELRNTDSDDSNDMDVSQMDENYQVDESCLEENENEEKTQTNNIGGDLLNNDYSPLEHSADIDPCLPDLELQKSMWGFCDEGLLLHDNPMNPLSPKNSETMNESSPVSSPSLENSYMTNFSYKSAYASATDSSKNRMRRNSSSHSS